MFKSDLVITNYRKLLANFALITPADDYKLKPYLNVYAFPQLCRAAILFMLFYLSTSLPASAGKIKRTTNIDYAETGSQSNRLDVYYPTDLSKPKDVILFIHGGSWNSGKKETYWWLGRNLAKKG